MDEANLRQTREFLVNGRLPDPVELWHECLLRELLLQEEEKQING